MALFPGNRLGAYEILSAIGAGGMGEVYRARDTKLGRDVAIKTLPELAAGDPERLARFDREAQLLAALNHPSIAQIYGIEDSPAGKFLVLELVDGESLAERLSRDGRLPMADVLRIAGQIIDALEAAHDKGIIHRDLKPANIMITADGQVKVLDFGLARAMEASPASVSNSPTISLAATQAGVILGTAAYMSPEQAKGRVADKRSDVWAFGCVLYEMVTGRRAFEGEDVSDTLAAILRGEPDWTALPADVPAHVTAIVRRCLTRDRKARVPDISVVRYLLSDPAPAVVAPARGAISRTRLVAGMALCVVLGAALSAAAWWRIAAGRVPPAASPVRVDIVAGALPLLSGSVTERLLALSPDGRHLAYVGTIPSGGLQLVVRRLNRLDATPLPGTAGGRFPFFSPDGRWIGFFTGTELKKIAVDGGPAMPICRITALPRGGTWPDQGTIVFATDASDTGLMSVPSGGGEPRVLTAVTGHRDHVLPAALPNGRGILFTAVTRGQGESAQIGVYDSRSGETRMLVSGGSQPEYVDPGYLVYAAAGTLRSVRFDLERLEVVDDAAPMEDSVSTMTVTGAANYAVSRNGHLLLLPSDMAAVQRTLVWVDQKGREESIDAPPRAYVYARVSPDGTRLAFAARDQEHDIWIWDLVRKTQTRLTFNAALDTHPAWMPDSRRVVFQSAADGPPNLYMHAVDGTGTPQRLTTSNNLQAPAEVTRDGKSLLMAELSPQTTADIFVLPLDGKSKPVALLQTPFNESVATLSPNGRWLAYQSNDAGALNVYVTPFPAVSAGRWHISPAGGQRPMWSHDGRQLFYLDLKGAMMAVPIDAASTFRAGNPTKLFDARYFIGVPGRSFDVSADGRFVMIKEPAPEQARHASLVLVLNWAEELKAKLPVK